MQRAVPANENDLTAAWTVDDAKWASLVAGFKAAEGWKVGTTVTTEKLSSDPKNATLVAYYQRPLGSTP
jgi:3-phenylpropionate/cinnamic acid dioxygenase small subunit